MRPRGRTAQARTRHRTRHTRTALGAAALLTLTTLAANTAPAHAAPVPETTPSKASDDRAWTTTGDAEGFHLMVADAKDGYGWRTAATLAEAGFDTDMWIGNACVTGSGRRAVVVYAPRTFTNKPQLMARGGFTAVVDLTSGEVTKLDLQASLSYYNPGCGVDESAVLTQSAGEDKPSTRLIRVNAATGGLATPVEAKGQLTSAVPVKDGSIVAAGAGALVKVAPNGATTAVAKTDGVPFRLTADKDGGVVYLDQPPATPDGGKSAAPAGRPSVVPGTAAAKRVSAGQVEKPAANKTKPVKLAVGPLAGTGLTRDAAGTVYITGAVTKTGKLPGATKLLPRVSKDAKVSTKGEAIVTRTQWADGKDSRISADKAEGARPVTVDVTRTATGQTTTAVVDPAAKPGPNIGQGKERSPKLVPRSTAKPRAAAPRAPASDPSTEIPSPTETVESERYCSVPRNDPRNQAMQPKPRQVEWAVDQAVQGTLNQNISRPANWKNLGMAAYAPQGLFPLKALSGGGRVPAQVMLGITAQESNMWQAGRYAVPGVTGNPLIGNYYGIDYYDGDPSNDWDVNWSKSDCGYGIAQITDGMHRAGYEKPGEYALSYHTQRAVALDYATNIAAGLQIVSEKWNQTRDAGMTINNGDPSKIENWYFALWAYNAGFHPNNSDGSPWGVGWANNPANPEWDAGRTPFMEDWLGNDDYRDAAHPQDWPYQEKVIGFAGHALEGLESPGKTVAGYRNAWWNGAGGDASVPGSAKFNRAHAKPAEDTFCQIVPDDLGFDCDASRISDDATNDNGPCRRTDLKCWWHKPVTWKPDCSVTCGNELVRFNSTYKEEADGTAYPPSCTTTGLPGGALIVDDVPDDVPSVRPGCGHPWANAGTFTMTFGNNPVPNIKYPAKVDTHQIGAGFGGHFYFAHTRKDDAKGQLLKVAGTWKLNQPVVKPVRVFVHVPDHGAQTTRAVYEINTGYGKPQRVVIPQPSGQNRWVPLGYYKFTGAPSVTLTNITDDGTGDADIAYDAMAFVPIEGRWMEQSFDAVAIFDKDQNLDTDIPWLAKTPFRTMTTLRDWAVERSYGGKSWTGGEPTVGMGMQPVCEGANRGPDCVGPATHAAAMQWYDDAVRGGTGHGDGAPDMTPAIWMGFANSRPSAEIDPHGSFTGDESYKIKTHVEARFIADPDGKIISGTEQTAVTTRTGDTHIAPFVLKLMEAIEQDYGVPAPNLAHGAVDANAYSGGALTQVNPNETGRTPGQAYLPNVTAPLIVKDGKCLESRSVSGGTIGYRPLVASTSVQNETTQWLDRVNRLAASGYLPASVKIAVGDIYSLFFKMWGPNGVTGSLFNAAPPIWQNVSIAFCSDGSVVPTAQAYNQGADPPYGLVTQSWMPDMYLYLNGLAIDNSGHATAGPATKGNFRKFSELPLADPNPYGYCDINNRGNSGNPWNITAGFDGPGETPTNGMYCDTRRIYNTTHTG